MDEWPTDDSDVSFHEKMIGDDLFQKMNTQKNACALTLRHVMKNELRLW